VHEIEQRGPAPFEIFDTVTVSLPSFMIDLKEPTGSFCLHSPLAEILEERKYPQVNRKGERQWEALL
jgi:hypothetical protein